jgi:hypothetical protein
MAKQVQMSDETDTKLVEMVEARKTKAAHPASINKTSVIADLISRGHKRQFKGR